MLTDRYGAAEYSADKGSFSVHNNFSFSSGLDGRAEASYCVGICNEEKGF
jgi:hypothetical protein